MQPESWRRRIGESAFDVIAKKAGIERGLTEKDVAAVLTWAVEVAGFQSPEIPPRIVDPRGVKVIWPPAVLTSEGLARYYTSQGHRYFLLRMEQLLRAMAGPLSPRLQEALLAYEVQCEAEHVPILPAWADNRLFVGGTEPMSPELSKLLGRE